MSIFDAGLIEGADALEIKQTRLTNILSLVAPIVLLPVGIFYAWAGNFLIVAILSSASAIYICAFLFNRAGKGSIARFLVVITAALSTSSGAILLGRGAMVQCITIACIQFPFLLYSVKHLKWLIASVLALVFLYALTEISLDLFSPQVRLSPMEIKLNYHLNLIMLTVVLCVIVSFLYRENNRAVLSEKKEKEVAERLLLDIRSDLNAAKRIQQALMPASAMDFKHATANIWIRPMQEVGGDFYRCSELPGGKIRIFFGDAMGHGVQAALMTMAIRTEYDTIFDRVDDPGELAVRLNNQFHGKYKDLNTYATCILVDVIPAARQINFVSAGHPPQFLLRQGNIIELENTGPALGIIPNASYRKRQLEFDSHSDGLILYTDGITEGNNSSGEMFGEERLTNVIRKGLGNKPDIIAESCIRMFQEFVGKTPVQDDVMVMSLSGKVIV